MEKFLRYVRKNRLKIIVIILFIIFVYCVIHAADGIYKKQGEESVKTKETSQESEKNSINITSKQCEKTIKEFLDNCTEGNYEKAYQYLSEESLEKYPTLGDFEKNYCVQNSIKGKGYSIKKESGNSKNKYKITFNNLLSSGNKDSNTIINYYTVVAENEETFKIRIEM